MPRSEKGKQSSLRSRLLHATIPTPGSRNHSPSPSSPQRITDTESATIVFAHQTVQLGFLPPPDEIARMNTPILPLGTCAPSTTQAIPITEPSTSGGPSSNLNLQDNLYAAIGGLPTAVVHPTQTQQMGTVAYEGLKIVFQGLYDSSDLLLPLKAASGVLLTILKVVDVRGLMLRSRIIHDYYCALEGFREQDRT